MSTKVLIIILAVVLGLAVLTSCKKECEIAPIGVVDENVPSRTYINSHVFTMLKETPTGTNNTIRVWKFIDNEGKVFKVNSIDPALYWKYKEGDIIPTEIVLAIYNYE